MIARDRYKHRFLFTEAYAISHVELHDVSSCLHRESSAAVGSGHPRLTSGQVMLPADSPYDNSDSGLGNESPTEFTR